MKSPPFRNLWPIFDPLYYMVWHVNQILGDECLALWCDNT